MKSIHLRYKVTCHPIRLKLKTNSMEDLELKHNKILVVEDNNINQLVVKYTLQKLGVAIEIAANGSEAIEKIKTNNYDLILMDIQLPEMNGYDVTRYIRNQMKNSIPIIAMTALAINGEEEKCLECGMNGYVSKPFTVESLYNAINKVYQTPLSISHNSHVISTPQVAIDMSMLYEIAGDDTEYINTMVSTFLENMPATLKKIEDCIVSKDYDSLYKAAHYAKSSLSVIKISDIYTWVEEIEHNAKKRVELHTLDSRINKVKEKFAIAEQVLLQKFGAAV
jgi:CheY-like chemotaxis protein/HPt (histidine-containing phosphotransfer) domain-containing protein